MDRSTYHVTLTPPSRAPLQPGAYHDFYPVPLRDGSTLTLPIQPLPGGHQAIALLMANQTPFEVENGLSRELVKLAAEFSPEAVAGIPTLGLDYARLVARGLGFPNYTALGNSRKFWYRDELSVPVESVMSAGAKKSLFLDPTLTDRVAGKKVLVVDDVINTGGSAAAAIELLQRAGANVIGLAVILIEGGVWQPVLGRFGSDWPERVKGLGRIPIFQASGAGWVPLS